MKHFLEGCLLMLAGVLALQSASAQQGDPCSRCVTVLESRLGCPTDVTGNLDWKLTVRNDSDFAISYAFILQGPSNVSVAPNPYIFNPPLQPGEVRSISLVISGSYLGQTRLCFDIVFYNASLNRCCRLQTCVNLPECCFIITKDSIVCDPHTGDFLYTFTLFNQFPAIVQYIVVLSQTPGVTVHPNVTVLNPPMSYLGRATVTVRIRGAQPGQRVRLAIGLLNFLGGLCCSQENEITLPPCCFEISDASTVCTDEGVFYDFTITNWYPAEVCYAVIFPQSQGVSVAPNPVAFNPPLGYGQSRRVRLRIDAQGCQGGQVCLQIVLLDCAFRMCCSKSTCFEIGQNVVSRLWTTTRDFGEGTSDNIDISNDEIKLPRQQTFNYPWVWTTNFSQGTISKIDARPDPNNPQLRREVARYYAPSNSLVSRTTVDRFGNVWVECRSVNGVIQILDERNWTLEFDYNGNGQLDTSRDLNGDGCIQPNEMLPFGQDELVARYYHLSAYGTFPRALAIDLNGYLWVGLWNNRRLLQIDPNLPPALYGPHVGGGTPPVLENLEAPAGPYGFVVAASGYLYSATLGTAIFEWCPGDPVVRNDAQVTRTVSHPGVINYGIAADSSCRIWTVSFGNGRVVRWVPQQGQAGVSISADSQIGQQRGVNVDLNGFVWTSATGNTNIARWDPNTLQLLNTYTDTCSNTHSGIGIAFGGQIAQPSFQQPTVTFLDMNGNIIGCTNCPGMGPYNYNDFTGALLRFATQEGIWRTVYDGGCEGRIWGRLNWNAFIPEGTSVTVRVRAGDQQPIQTEFTTVGNGQEFCIRGRYLEVEVRLARTPRRVNRCDYELCSEAEEFVTPIVYDIRATSLCECADRALQDVRGKVLADTDVDGVPSNGDRPLQGWAVTIEDANGNYLTRYTNSEGEYLFRNIPNGEYRLVQITRPGWLPVNPIGGQTEITVNGSSVRVDFVNRLIGDVDGTFCVDDADLLQVLMAFGASGEGLPEDITMDGVVDDADLLQVLMHFGANC